MKHYLATHTCFTEESRRGFIEHSKVLTDRQMFEGIKTDKAQMLAHWMGKEEFFFCHWYAESEDAIFENLEKAGFNSLMMTLPNEMPRFVSIYNITNEEMQDPDG